MMCLSSAELSADLAHLYHRPCSETLRAKTPVTKLLWAYLRPQGVVSYTVRGMAEALGASPPSVATGLRRLELLKLLRYVGERQPRQRPTFEVLIEPYAR